MQELKHNLKHGYRFLLGLVNENCGDKQAKKGLKGPRYLQMAEA